LERGKTLKKDENFKTKKSSNGMKILQARSDSSAMLRNLPGNYQDVLKRLRGDIQTSRLKAQLSANAAMVLLYWRIGSAIAEQQEALGWGAKVIDRLAADLSRAFPDMRGFSPRNLKYMRAFALAWPDSQFVQRVVAQIPWRSNLALLDKIPDPAVRSWYAEMTLQEGWSQPVLVVQIESALHLRKGQLSHNFGLTLPPGESDLATQIFKDPYIFDFLGTTDIRRELELENALIEHIQKFLLELGSGFAFVGRQVLLEIGNQDFRLDLLFYHLKLRCFVIVELKIGHLEPSHVSQLGFYLSVVDDVMRHPSDRPSIGLLLVREKNQLIAEYCLRTQNQPMGIAEWKTEHGKVLPTDLQNCLPSVEQIEKELLVELSLNTNDESEDKEVKIK